MQTFLPYADFALSAYVLDMKRLGKQRVEVYQILKALRGETKGWANHPASKMWRGYEGTLVLYGLAICRDWVARGYKDTMTEKIQSYMPDRVLRPRWLGNEELHASHRSNLLRKFPEHYSKFDWKESPDLPYVWPES